MQSNVPIAPRTVISLWVRALGVCALIVALAGVVFVGAVCADPSPPGDRSFLTHSFEVPLDGGRLHLGLLLGGLLEQVGLDGQSVREQVTLSVDAQGALGAAKLQVLEAASGGIIAFAVEPDRLVVTLDRIELRRQEKALRTRFRAVVTQWFPDLADAAGARYGVWLNTEPDRWERPNGQPLQEDWVVLIHGLDEPGRIWSSLVPVLSDHGHAVARFEYPNDQPISESADLFAKHLAEMHTRGVRRVTIVAHSMGGLVGRAVLADPDHYAGLAKGNDGLPAIDRLILVGPPNHGSQMARFRLASEVRDQVVRTLSGDSVLFGSIFDGAGEAKLDLLPDSDFLTDLNVTALPDGLPITIIAGIASPVNQDKIDGLRGLLHEHLAAENHDTADQVASALSGLVEGVGDGVVSLESTRLPGVADHVTVSGNHLTMIRRMIEGIGDEPPAIAVIVDRLGQGDKGDAEPVD